MIIDTPPNKPIATVQIKNIKHPHNAQILGKAREELVKLADRLGFKLIGVKSFHMIGDIINPLISAIGFNLRGIANKITARA